MSYILESLKKSEQERRQSTSDENPEQVMGSAYVVDDSFYRHTADDEKKHRRFMLLIIIFALLFLLGAGAIFYFSPFDASSTSGGVTPETHTFDNAHVSIDGRQMRTEIERERKKANVNNENGVSQVSSTPAIVAQSTQDDERLKPLVKALVDESIVVDESAITKNDQQKSESNAAVSALYKRPTGSPLVQSLYENNQALSANVSDKSSGKSLPKVVSEKQVESSVEKTKRAEKERLDITSIFDLDRIFQRNIPEINYGAHIYASDNKSGFVILNGAKRLSGERMNNGVYIEKIAEDELILSYEGVVFSLPAMRNWTPY